MSFVNKVILESSSMLSVIIETCANTYYFIYYKELLMFLIVKCLIFEISCITVILLTFNVCTI